MKTSAMIASSIRQLRELASSTVPPLGRHVKSYREIRQFARPSDWTLAPILRSWRPGRCATRRWRARRVGSVVVVNDQICPARWMAKAHTASPAAFILPGSGPLGHIVEGRVHIQVRLCGRSPVVGPGSAEWSVYAWRRSRWETTRCSSTCALNTWRAQSWPRSAPDTSRRYCDQSRRVGRAHAGDSHLTDRRRPPSPLPPTAFPATRSRSITARTSCRHWPGFATTTGRQGCIPAFLAGHAEPDSSRTCGKRDNPEAPRGPRCTRATPMPRMRRQSPRRHRRH